MQQTTIMGIASTPRYCNVITDLIYFHSNLTQELQIARKNSEVKLHCSPSISRIANNHHTCNEKTF